MKKVPRVDWVKFYRYLSRLNVPMPTPVAGEPMDLDNLRDLMILVQENRTKLDLRGQVVDRRLGRLRAELDILTETRRLERAQAMQEPSLWHAKSTAYREAILDTRLGPISARIAHTKAMIHQYEAAKDAIGSQAKTLEFAKQTLNGLKGITLAEFESIDDSGAPGNTWSRGSGNRNQQPPRGRRIQWDG